MKTYDVVVHEVVRKTYVVKGNSKEDAEENYLYNKDSILESEKYIDEEIVNICKRPPGIEFHKRSITKDDRNPY